MKYKIKLTALTPIHIGSGEFYEPTNFVIDKGYLYEFDEIEFFRHLDDKQKQNFLRAVESNSSESLFEVHRVIKANKEIAKKVAFQKVQVSKGIESDYNNKVGKVVQIEGGRRIDKRKVFNKFEIAKTARLVNQKKVYLPGSSIKGSLLTAFGEFVLKNNRNLFYEMFHDCLPSQKGNIFKNVSVSDALPITTYAIIGYALNKERFEEDNTGPKVQLEVIYSSEKQHSEFEIELDINENDILNINNLKEACNNHYLPIFEEQFQGYATFKGKKVDDWTNEYFSESFYKKYKDIKLNKNQFLIRVGKYSQARAVTIDGLRKIRVKVSGGGPKRKPNKWETLNQETTTWMFGLHQNANYNLMPFGWVLCEVMK
jgi:CRISPR-associated protein Csm5